MDGWMTFLAERPLCGIDPHPAYAPNIEGDNPTNAAEWAEVYGVFSSLREANLSIAEDADIIEDDDADVALRVRVDDDGTLHIFDDMDQSPFVVFSAEDVLKAYGITLQ